MPRREARRQGCQDLVDGNRPNAVERGRCRAEDAREGGGSVLARDRLGRGNRAVDRRLPGLARKQRCFPIARRDIAEIGLAQRQLVEDFRLGDSEFIGVETRVPQHVGEHGCGGREVLRRHRHRDEGRQRLGLGLELGPDVPRGHAEVGCRQVACPTNGQGSCEFDDALLARRGGERAERRGGGHLHQRGVRQPVVDQPDAIGERRLLRLGQPWRWWGGGIETRDLHRGADNRGHQRPGAGRLAENRRQTARLARMDMGNARIVVPQPAPRRCRDLVGCRGSDGAVVIDGNARVVHRLRESNDVVGQAQRILVGDPVVDKDAGAGAPEVPLIDRAVEETGNRTAHHVLDARGVDAVGSADLNEETAGQQALLQVDPGAVGETGIDQRAPEQAVLGIAQQFRHDAQAAEIVLPERGHRPADKHHVCRHPIVQGEPHPRRRELGVNHRHLAAARNSAEGLGNLFPHFVGIEVADHRENGIVGDIVGAEQRRRVIESRRFEVGDRTIDRAAVGMRRWEQRAGEGFPGRAGDVVENVLADLVDHHAALHLEGVGRDVLALVGHPVGLDRQDVGQRRGHAARVIEGVVVPGGGVEVDAKRPIGGIDVREGGRAREHQVLEQMGEARAAGRLVHHPYLVGEIDERHGRAVVGDQHDIKPVI